MTFLKTAKMCTTGVAAALCLSGPTLAETTDAGAYLAARQAGIGGDYSAAAAYFQHALIADPNNPVLIQQTLTAYLGSGQVETAAAIGRTFTASGGDSQVANMAIMAQAARSGNWGTIFDMLEAGHEVGPLLDGLGQAWAFVGLGQMDRALASFDEVADTPGLRNFGQQHKAMALTIMGELEAAEAIYSLPPNEGIVPTRGSVSAHLQILCRLGQFDKARGIVTRAFGSDMDPEIAELRDAIEAGQIPRLDNTVSNPAEGLAYAFKSLSDILQGEANESYLLLYAQAARHIAPQDADTHIAAARLLNALEQYNDAAVTFAQVSTEDPAYHSAELGRAEALRLDGQHDKAIEVLTQLTRSHPDLPLAHASLGDVFRQQSNYAAANSAYDAALEANDADTSIRWWLLYSRGMTHERLDQWDAAEADFRAALDLNPGNPSILNYLGYSLVDRGMKFDEAVTMIETAAEARPDSGAIIDSLGWAYYKLGRYEDAVGPMERAVELAPNDPVISDHLGDVYWKVGREVEARFQWARALSFGPSDEDADRIRRKLNLGLDAVYAEEGVDLEPAVEVANDAN
ncbi:tetratricopeptide repeat protein [Pseudooctadecabacter jejudonensis]|uniref:Lipoprotein NlpI n=1 Tax=Pseudooctadecabacter jejudonensis TaxID=1391910 RepID=A0A1Y5T0S6_9RHOB|nr:tetratricopeptide repeat protein [Pseudooctadecabacter jejudonensis]SLN53354.1 lipoprotein NlpI [Pseudooctadecabacter jejudonensis]